MAQTSHLETRIRAALNPQVSRAIPTPRMRTALTLVSAIGVLALVVVKTQAQPGTSQLYGSVLDISGAVIPGAEVTASIDGRKEITHSGMDGKYSFAGIPQGVYVVEVRVPGFALLTQRNVALVNGEARHIDLTLQMGRIHETVTVTGKKPPVLAAHATSGTPQRIRVGGNVQASKLLYMRKPEYPEQLQQQGIEGTVLLEGVISMQGDLLSLRSLNSLVNPELTKAAIDAVKQWRYQPTLLNGKPVEIITTISVNFTLAQ